MSAKVNFSKTLFSASAPGAAYFELVVIFQHICTDVDYLTELAALNRPPAPMWFMSNFMS